MEKNTMVLDISSMENGTPPKVNELDTTKVIVDRIAAFMLSEEKPGSMENVLQFPASVVSIDTTIVKEIHFDIVPLDESTQVLSNIYDLHHFYIENGNVDVQSNGVETDIIRYLGGVENAAQDNGRFVEERRKYIKYKDQNNGLKEGVTVDVAVEEEKEEDKENEDYSLQDKEVEEKEVIKFKLTKKNQECDILGKRLFDMTQELKIALDRTRQLEDNNKYRDEVLRLEEPLEGKTEMIEDMKEEAKNSNSKIAWLEKLIEENDNEIK